MEETLQHSTMWNRNIEKKLQNKQKKFRFFEFGEYIIIVIILL